VYLVPKLHFISPSLVFSSLCPWLDIHRLTPYIHFLSVFFPCCSLWFLF